MLFARWVFRVAGIIGLLMLLPMFWLEEWIGREQPPSITHPEFFYGFVGVAVAWQVAFLIIALDPPRYRLLMIPAMIEKFSFVGTVFVLWVLGRTGSSLVAAGALDLTWGVLFSIAWSFCPRR